MEDLDKSTPEQKKELSKALSKARFDLLKASIKFGLGVFAANFITIMIGQVVLVDVNPNFVIGYHTLCIVVNTMFMSHYFTSQMSQINDRLCTSVEEIKKK